MESPATGLEVPASTTMTASSQSQTSPAVDGAGVVHLSRDLRHAIRLLLSVPSLPPTTVITRRRPRHSGRPVNDSRQTVSRHSAERLSLPLQSSSSSHCVRDEPDLMSRSLNVRLCSSLTDSVDAAALSAADNSTELKQTVATASAESVVGRGQSGSSRFRLPWNIRRVKKHKLERVQSPSRPSGQRPVSLSTDAEHTQRVEVHTAALASSTDVVADKVDRRSGSDESLDSVVERILENAVTDTERQRRSKRRRRDDAAGRYLEQNSTRLDQHITAEKRLAAELVNHRCTLPPDSDGRHRVPVVASAGERKQRYKNKHQSGLPGSSGARAKATNCTARAHNQQPQLEKRAERSLEDLFEEAVESLQTSDTEDFSDAAPRHRRTRSSENWERQVFDSELHQQCRAYRLQAYAYRDYSKVSRGVAIVHKRNRNPASPNDTLVQQKSPETGSDPRRMLPRDAAYLQRTVISAKAEAPPAKPQSNDATCPPQQSAADCADSDIVDLCLERELAANKQQSTAGRLSQSSSTTWDSVSVDSLVMYEDERTAVHGLYSATDSKPTGDVGQEFVLRLRQLADDWQQTLQQRNDNDDDETIWVRMTDQQTDTTSPQSMVDELRNSSDSTPTTNSAESQKRELIGVSSAASQSGPQLLEQTVLPASLEDKSGVLSETVTTQQIVINIKLPRRQSGKSRRARSGVPFREIQLCREIRLQDDVTDTRSVAALTSATDNDVTVTSPVEDDVTSGDRQLKKLVEGDTAVATRAGCSRLAVTASHLLDAERLTELGVDATVEQQISSSNTSRSVDQLPADSLTDSTSQQYVDVSRSQSQRVVHLPETSSSQVDYIVPSLQQTVDNIRCAMLESGGGARPGVAVSCHAVETTWRRADDAQPVVRNIVVNCLPPCSTDVTN